MRSEALILRALGAFLLLSSIATQGTALAQQSIPRKFEVASIKRSAPDSRWGYDAGRGERAQFNDFLVRELIQFAWHTQIFRIVHEPAWLETEHYDIQATTEDTVSEDEVRIMLRQLLAERFGLSIRTESREMPVYKLVSAKSVSKLTVAKHGACLPLENYSGPQPPPENLVPPVCGVRQRLRSDASGAQVMQLQETGVTLADFARHLGGLLDRQVDDESGVPGVFDFSLEYAPDPHLAARLSTGSQPVDSSVPELFTALEEQLGLKLVASKGPVQVLVIEHILRPSEN